MLIEKKPPLDRRVLRTRRNLRLALFSLILEQGYDLVTIEEITNRADVGRTTFYLHYRDKEDLLMESVGDLVDGLVDQLSHVPIEQWKEEEGGLDIGEVPLAPITLAFQHVAQNANLYRIILRGDGTYSAIQHLREIIIQAVLDLLRNFTSHDNLIMNPQVPLEVFVHSLAGAWIGLVSWWLEQDLPYPPEQVAVMYHRMFMRSTREILGIQQR